MASHHHRFTLIVDVPNTQLQAFLQGALGRTDGDAGHPLVQAEKAINAVLPDGAKVMVSDLLDTGGRGVDKIALLLDANVAANAAEDRAIELAEGR